MVRRTGVFSGYGNPLPNAEGGRVMCAGGNRNPFPIRPGYVVERVYFTGHAGFPAVETSFVQCSRTSCATGSGTGT